MFNISHLLSSTQLVQPILLGRTHRNRQPCPCGRLQVFSGEQSIIGLVNFPILSLDTIVRIVRSCRVRAKVVSLHNLQSNHQGESADPGDQATCLQAGVSTAHYMCLINSTGRNFLCPGRNRHRHSRHRCIALVDPTTLAHA